MSLALVNPLGYGSDKIFDPKDNIPYTYRVNQHYDQAQFMAYLENPRFERTIEIAGRWRIQEIASQSLTSALPSNLPSLFSQAYTLDTAYALDSSTTDLSSRYPYSAGDRLGIFLSKGSRQPLQNGVSGTGSRDISLSDASTLDIIVGSQWADEYVSTDISTGSLNALKSGTFDEKALLGMNSGTGSGGDGGDSGGGGGLPVSHILTVGEYSINYGGESGIYYGYIGSEYQSLLQGYWMSVTVITPGSLIDDTVDGYVIDSFFLDSNENPAIVLAGATDMPSTVILQSPFFNLNCGNQSAFTTVTGYNCNGSGNFNDFYVWSQHDLGISFNMIGNCQNGSTLTDESYFTFNSNSGTITWYSSSGPKQVVIPPTIGGVNVVNIGSAAFALKWLKCVNIPNGITNIWELAFFANSITSAVISNSVVNIGMWAFNRNNLPNSDAFIYARNPDGSQDTSTIIGYGGAQRDNIVIPNSVTSIGGENAFYNNNITSIIIPNSVTSLGNWAFAMNQLTSINIPNSVTNIWTGAFSTNQLTSVMIPNSVTNIGRAAFFKNNLTSVTIPNSVTNIWLDAFGVQTNSPWNGTVYGPASWYVKNTYINNPDTQFDKGKLPNYVDQ